MKNMPNNLHVVPSSCRIQPHADQRTAGMVHVAAFDLGVG